MYMLRKRWRDQVLQELLLQETAEDSKHHNSSSLVAGHELGGVVPGVVAGGVSQVLVQVGNGALQGWKAAGSRF
jgi:hypothetical protein